MSHGGKITYRKLQLTQTYTKIVKTFQVCVFKFDIFPLQHNRISGRVERQYNFTRHLVHNLCDD